MELKRLEELFIQGRELLYNGSTPEDLQRARELLGEAKEALQKLTGEEDQRAYLLLAKVAYELGNSYFGDGGKKAKEEAEGHFEAALAAAERALALEESAEGHCLLGESLSRLIEFKGWTFAATAGPKAKKAFERALEIDPQSAQAHIDLGLSYFFTPKIFGGSLEKALQLLEKGLELAPDPHIRFLAHLWLSQVNQKRGEKERAGYHLKEAEKIYPQSGWLKSLSAGLE